MHSRVLQVGTDELLLATRGLVLRYAGLDVESRFVLNRPDSIHLCIERYFDGDGSPSSPKDSFDAVILCHTLDEECATAIAGEARREDPAAKIVLLEALTSLRLPAELYDVIVSTKYGPATMLAALESILNEKADGKTKEDGALEGMYISNAASKTSPSPRGRANAAPLPRAPARRSQQGK